MKRQTTKTGRGPLAEPPPGFLLMLGFARWLRQNRMWANAILRLLAEPHEYSLEYTYDECERWSTRVMLEYVRTVRGLPFQGAEVESALRSYALFWLDSR